MAHEVLGDKAIAVTGLDAFVPERELHEASDYCKEKGITHFVKRVDPLKEEGYKYNSPGRCYYCKHTVFTAMRQVADENGIEYLAEGSNMDDLGDYRPGLQADACQNAWNSMKRYIKSGLPIISFLFRIFMRLDKAVPQRSGRYNEYCYQ